MHPVVIEAIVFAAIVFVAVTQVILPALIGAPLFPSVRFRKASAVLDEAKADTQVAELHTEIKRERKLARSIRNQKDDEGDSPHAA